jgi:hypothetical protein
MLRDVVELRQNKWIRRLRRDEHYNPKTIDQIHKEAQIEEMQEQRLAVQFPVKNKKQKQGGPGNIMEQAFAKCQKYLKTRTRICRYHSVSSKFSVTTTFIYLFFCVCWCYVLR